MKAQRPRRSHYLPKFYLAGFTASGEVGKLYVFDRIARKNWSSSPRQAATERDFYVVDLGPGEDPDIMEKVFSHLEGEFSRVVRDIITQRQLPTGGYDFDLFLNFVASMVARIPRTRKVVSRAIDKGSKAELRRALATREGWAQFRQVCAAAGHQVGDDKYEEYKRVAESEDYSVNLDKTSHVQMMVKQMMDELLPALAARSWSLGIATDDSPDLICSDVPVAVWPVKGADVGKPITLLSRNTSFLFPLPAVWSQSRATRSKSQFGRWSPKELPCSTRGPYPKRGRYSLRHLTSVT